MMRAASATAALSPSTSSMAGFSSTSRSAGHGAHGQARGAQLWQDVASVQRARVLYCVVGTPEPGQMPAASVAAAQLAAGWRADPG